jgi:hypothetical protein
MSFFRHLPVTSLEDVTNNLEQLVPVVPWLVAASGATVMLTEKGAKVDNHTDDSGAWAAAVKAVEGGGTIIMPPGNSVVESGINLEKLRNINIVAQGSAEGGSAIKTGRTDGGPLINVKKSAGISFFGLELFHFGPPATAAVVIEAAGTAEEATDFLSLERCQVVASLSAESKVNLIHAPNCISHRYAHCIFNGGENAILGREAGTFLNGLEIDACTFTGQRKYPLVNLGQTAEIHSCVFEPNFSKEPLVLFQEEEMELLGFEFHGNQTADASKATGNTLVLNGRGINIHSNYFQTGGGEGTKECIVLNNTTEGMSIRANVFNSFKLGIDKNGKATAGVEIGPNVYQLVGVHHNFAAAGVLYIEA